MGKGIVLVYLGSKVGSDDLTNIQVASECEANGWGRTDRVVNRESDPSITTDPIATEGESRALQSGCSVGHQSGMLV